MDHIRYIDKKRSSGKLKEVYNHIELNFGKIAEPFVIHSINSKLTAGVWAMLFETVLIETEIKRSLKEAIATCISDINKCSYCVDAHSVMILGTEKKLQSGISKIKKENPELKSKEDKMISWALNNLNFESKIIQDPPFGEDEAAEIIGTAVLFHYINRVVNVFGGETPLPTLKMKAMVKLFAVNFIFKKAIKRKKVKGESLVFFDDNNYQSSFEWADRNPEILIAFQYFKLNTEKNIGKFLSTDLIMALKKSTGNSDLLKPVPDRDNLDTFLNKIKPSEREIAEFCFLIMYENYKIHDKHLNKLKEKFTDEEILQVAAFSSFLIAESIGNKLFSNMKKR